MILLYKIIFVLLVAVFARSNRFRISESNQITLMNNYQPPENQLGPNKLPNYQAPTQPNLNNNSYQAQNIAPPNNIPYKHFLSQVALLACGFEQATSSSTPKEIWNIHPHGGTAMRDSLIYGNNLMLKLHDLLQKQHTAAKWNFIHILLTDGHDTDSVATFDQTYQQLSSLRADLNVKDLKIIILGIGIEYTYAQQLRNLIMAAGIHGEYHDVQHTDIAHMFHNFRKNFGLGDRIPNLNPYDVNGNQNINADLGGQNDDLSEGDEQFYAVLFNLDISGSMAGHKWDVCRHAVVDFIGYLNEDDIVSSIVFNDYPHLVMHWSTRQSQMALGQLTNFQPLQQAQVNEAYFDPAEFTPVQKQQLMYQNSMGYKMNQGGNMQPRELAPVGSTRSDQKSKECCEIM